MPNMANQAYTYIKAAWDSFSRESWERFNSGVYKTFLLAAELCEWRAGELERVLKIENSSRSSIGRALGCEWSDRFYAISVQAGNGSAIAEWERHHNWKPIIADDVGNGRGIARKRGRIFVGCTFLHSEGRLRCTSFKDGYAVCVLDGEKKKVFKLTADDVIRDRAERKKQAGSTKK